MESCVLYFDEPSDESQYQEVILDEQKVADMKTVYNCLGILKKEVKSLIYDYQLKDEVKHRQWMYKTVSGLRNIQKDIRMEQERLKDPHYYPKMEDNLNINESLDGENEKNYNKEKITEELLSENENCLDVFYNTDWDKMAPEDYVKDSFDKENSYIPKNLNNTDGEPFINKSKEAQVTEMRALVLQFEKEVAKYSKMAEELKRREEATVCMLNLKHELDKKTLNNTIAKLQGEISSLRRQSILPVNNNRLTRFSAICCSPKSPESCKYHSPSRSLSPTRAPIPLITASTIKAPISPRSSLPDLMSVRKKLTSVNSTPLFSLQSSETLRQKPRKRKSSLQERKSSLPEGKPALMEMTNKSELFHKELENYQLMKQFLDYRSKCNCSARSSLDLNFLESFHDYTFSDSSTQIQRKEEENSELMRQLRDFESKCNCRASSNLSFVDQTPQDDLQPLILL